MAGRVLIFHVARVVRKTREGRHVWKQRVTGYTNMNNITQPPGQASSERNVRRYVRQSACAIRTPPPSLSRPFFRAYSCATFSSSHWHPQKSMEGTHPSPCASNVRNATRTLAALNSDTFNFRITLPHHDITDSTTRRAPEATNYGRKRKPIPCLFWFSPNSGNAPEGRK